MVVEVVERFAEQLMQGGYGGMGLDGEGEQTHEVGGGEHAPVAGTQAEAGAEAVCFGEGVEITFFGQGVADVCGDEEVEHALKGGFGAQGSFDHGAEEAVLGRAPVDDEAGFGPAGASDEGGLGFFHGACGGALFFEYVVAFGGLDEHGFDEIKGAASVIGMGVEALFALDEIVPDDA